ncbi:glycosyltransferase family 9 protein [Candidatus Poribacteria bacterium]|nr:glycosyltransferase family 9 protein [Candidatus Poribacteria bacterium]MYB65377.1 glycosyltransferase family 9 protein [Candidatus Poribacteria bacterium]
MVKSLLFLMQRVLVCHTGAWIGDMVLLTPALRALKERLPDSHITFLLRAQVVDLMKTNPYVDSCLVDKKKDSFFSSFVGLTKIIRNRNFDIAVVLHPTSFRNALLPFFAQVPFRIGSNYKGRGFLLSASCPANRDIHEVQRYLSVMSLLNDNDVLDGDDTALKDRETALEFWHTETDRKRVKKLLRSHGVSVKDRKNRKDRLIAVNIGTTWQTKRWDIERFETVIRELIAAVSDTKIIITGSVSEQNLVDQLPYIDSTINLVGKTNLLELGALLEMCALCLTCDSGPMHIAAAVGTPCVALFGPTDPMRHQPYGEGHTIIEKPVSCRPCYKRTCMQKDVPYLCMKEIETSHVLDVVLERLNGKKRKT